MKTIKNLFANLFMVAAITNLRLIDFAQDMLARLNKNNPGNIYDAIIADTQVLITNLLATLGNRSTDSSTYSGSTLSKSIARAQLYNYLKRKEGLIKDKFGKPSPEYNEFFPQGLTGYLRATDAEFRIMAQTAVAKATQYESTLGAAFKTELNDLYKAYDSAFNTQDTNKSNISTASAEEQAAELSLERQLTTNSLFIAYHNVDNATAFDTYFNTNLLYPPHRVQRKKGKAPASATSQVMTLIYSAGKILRLRNKGAATLSFQFWLDNMPVGTAITVLAGEEVDKQFSDFFSNGDSLKVSNPTVIEGMYEVTEVA